MISNIGDLSVLKRYDIINYIIEKNNYNSYLEIGTLYFTNFNKININNKESIDPAKLSNNTQLYTYNMTSDEAFIEIQKDNKKYDIIFIDGLHYNEQVTRDIKNSLNVLNANGTIILHDCNPPTALHACYPPPDPINRPWNGDCYKSIIKFKYENMNMFVKVVDTDWGVGIIQPDRKDNINQNYIEIIELVSNENDILTGGTIQINNKNLTWDFFDNNRNNLLNLIDEDEFYKLFS